MTEDTKEALATVPEQQTAIAEPPPDFLPRMAERITKALENIEPATLDGYHEHHKYHYSTIGQLRSLSNRALARAGIAVIPSVMDVRRQESQSQQGKRVMQTAVKMQFTVVTPEGRQAVEWYGESDDTSDKGLAKAITAATKSFLTNFLLIPMAQIEEEAEEAPEDLGRAGHWIHREAVQKRFWKWTGEDLGLTEAEVHQALDVESVYEFRGTMEQARDAINEWLNRKIAQGPVQEQVEVLFGSEQRE